MSDYAPWVDSAYMQKTDDRVGMLNAVVENFARHGKDAEKIATAISDQQDFCKPSFLTHIHFIPLNKTTPGEVQHVMFQEPVMAAKHREKGNELPLVIAVASENKTIRDNGEREKLSDVKKDFEVKQALSWANVVSRMTRSEKQDLVDLIIDGIRAQRKSKRSDQVWLSDYLRNEKDFEIIGFALNAPYINVDRSWGDTKPLWVHPWGIPAILGRHRKLPSLVMASPTIRLNENINGSKAMEGYTG